MNSTSIAATPRRPVWPWLLFVLALGWTVLVRIPLVLNAESHLDSDLAVDGLMVADVVRGHWHWHFPGTPHIGIASAVFAAPQMAIWGADPIPLSSSGIVESGVLLLAVFLLAWKVYGPRVAAWSLVPLTFTSTGMLWLGGRLNSGHLLAAAWHAGALAWLYACLARGGLWRAAGFGLWCGLGLWHDNMMLISVGVVVLTTIITWSLASRSSTGFPMALVFGLALVVGDLPYELGRRFEPYDAYREQFRPIFRADVLGGHAEILFLQCLPRLVAGHLLFDLHSEPTPAALLGSEPTRGASGEFGPLALMVTLLSLGLFVAGFVSLVRGAAKAPDVAKGKAPPETVAREAVRWAILGSSAAIVAAFILNQNIFNSDNYRYIVFLVVPWAIGFGLLMDRLTRRELGGVFLAAGLALALSMFMTLDTIRWYERFGWIQDGIRPIRQHRPDPVLDWLNAHPDVKSVYGGYWDVYRYSLLTHERVKGIPYPQYPNRFPEWSRALPGGMPEVFVLRAGPGTAEAYRLAMTRRARLALQTPNVLIFELPPER